MRAQRDLEGIFDYTTEKWDLSQAPHNTDLIEAACAELAKAPQQSQGWAYIRPGYRRLSVERHILYFRCTTYDIAVIRFLHQRMDATRHLWL
ncbi:type II toxin-antitoxin system RelE/ParE family toxin [Sphingobium sp. MK2]|uniref:type II toxin-antitoxin system RelE/ParE family toxin n=1 Tax=Sphingobium sp. MK2 TaxID=3116540 RepID=UPI0032E3604B